MRRSAYALLAFTVISVTVGVVAAVSLPFRGANVERPADSSLAVMTKANKVTSTTVTATSFLEINPLWTTNTIKPETIVIDVRTDLSAIIATTNTSPTVDCDHQWCRDGTSTCACWAGVTGWGPTKGPIPGETITLCNCVTAIQYEGRKGLDTLANKELITPVPTAPVDCKYKYCDNNTQYCMYWAGVTGWDLSLGPIPGMTRTSLGACQIHTTNLTTERAVQTTMATKKCMRSRTTTTF